MYLYNFITRNLFAITSLTCYTLGMVGWLDDTPWYVWLPLSLLLGVVIAKADDLYQRTVVRRYIKAIKEEVSYILDNKK